MRLPVLGLVSYCERGATCCERGKFRMTINCSAILTPEPTGQATMAGIDDWKEHISKKSGKKFYFSKSRNLSVWHDASLPEGWALLMPSEHVKLYMHMRCGNTEKSAAACTTTHHCSTSEKAAKRPRSPAASSELPPAQRASARAGSKSIVHSGAARSGAQKPGASSKELPHPTMGQAPRAPEEFSDLGTQWPTTLIDALDFEYVYDKVSVTSG